MNYLSLLSFLAIFIYLFDAIYPELSGLHREKQQAKIFVISGAITFVLCFSNDYPIPGFHFMPIPLKSQFFILILAISVWYAIIRYKIPGLVTLVKIEDVVNKVTDLVFLIDDNHKIVDYNQRVTEKLAYRKAMPFAKALAELKRNAGTQFDPAVVAQFLELLNDRLSLMEQIT